MACPKQATSTQPLCNFRPLKEASGRAGHLSLDKRLILLITGAVWDPAGRRVEGSVTHVILTTQTTS